VSLLTGRRPLHSDSSGEMPGAGGGGGEGGGGGGKEVVYHEKFSKVCVHKDVDVKDVETDTGTTVMWVSQGRGRLRMKLVRDQGGSGWFLTALHFVVSASPKEVLRRSAALSSIPTGLKTQTARYVRSLLIFIRPLLSKLRGMTHFTRHLTKKKQQPHI
jgi:hypothetical protein